MSPIIDRLYHAALEPNLHSLSGISTFLFRSSHRRAKVSQPLAPINHTSKCSSKFRRCPPIERWDLVQMMMVRDGANSTPGTCDKNAREPSDYFCCYVQKQIYLDLHATRRVGWVDSFLSANPRNTSVPDTHRFARGSSAIAVRGSVR